MKKRVSPSLYLILIFNSIDDNKPSPEELVLEKIQKRVDRQDRLLAASLKLKNIVHYNKRLLKT